MLAINGLLPFSVITPQLQHTYFGLRTLSHLVDLSPGTLLQYNFLCLQSFHASSFGSSPSSPLSPVTTTFFDPFQFDNLHPTAHIVHAYGILDSTFHPSSVEPSPRAFNALCDSRTTVFRPFDAADHHFPVIFDYGASRAISGCKDDFVTPITKPPTAMRLGGMANGMSIEGIGKVKWTFQVGQEVLVLHTSCFYVPSAKARLLSPQRLFNAKEGTTGSFSCLENNATLQLNDLPTLTIPYDARSYLPIHEATSYSSTQLNLSINDSENQNLKPSQHLLNLWHQRFGYHNYQYIQRILRDPLFTSPWFSSASRCEIPTCSICQFAKAHRASTKGKISLVDKSVDGSLTTDYLKPGAGVSVDHFESRLKGQTYTSFGKTMSEQYKGGCIFMDHMRSYVHVEQQLGFSGPESIRSKQNFESMALEHGIVIENTSLIMEFSLERTL